MVVITTPLVVGAGALATLFGGLYFGFEKVLEVGVRSQLNIVNPDIFSKWMVAPIEIEYKFYFFEVLNPREAVNGAKVKVRQRGPYFFSQTRSKKIISWGANNESVKYYEYRTYYWQPERSEGNSLDDRFTMVNPIFVALGNALSELIEQQIPLLPVTGPLVYGVVNSFLDAHGQGLFMKKSVREMIYGYKVNILETVGALTQPLTNLGIKLEAIPKGPANNTFGLLYETNGTAQGPFEVYTGVGSTSERYSTFISYKDKTLLPWWKGSCNTLVGTDGTAFPPFITKDTILYAFAPEICRSVSLVYEQDSEFKGISSMRFVAKKSDFDGLDRNPDNACFCSRTGKKKSWCSGQHGVFDVGGCNAGAPLFLSNPHFFDSDPDLSRLVIGLNPKKELHQSRIDVEPISGVPIDGSKKLQGSLKVGPIPMLKDMGRVRSAFIPLFFAIEGAGLSDELADEVKLMLIMPVTVASGGVTGLAAASVGAFLVLLAMFYKKKNEKDVKLTPVKPFKPPSQPIKALQDIARRESHKRKYSVAQPPFKKLPSVESIAGDLRKNEKTASQETFVEMLGDDVQSILSEERPPTFTVRKMTSPKVAQKSPVGKVAQRNRRASRDTLNQASQDLMLDVDFLTAHVKKDQIGDHLIDPSEPLVSDGWEDEIDPYLNDAHQTISEIIDKKDAEDAKK